jgi:hypothetical protein
MERDDVAAVVDAPGGSRAATVRTRAWARVWPATKREHSKQLRHGAWYPVIDDDRPDRVTLEIAGRRVVVPRRILEITPERPTRFAVIHRLDHVPGKRDSFGLGRHYGVCPTCRWRFGIIGRPERETCPKCGLTAEVAWWETV